MRKEENLMETPRWYTFKCYRRGHAVWKRVQIFAWGLRDALGKIDVYCENHGYIDFDLEE